MDPDSAVPGAPPNGEIQTPAATEGGDPPLTLADVKSLFESQFASYRKTNNKEMEKLRRGAKPSPDSPAPSDSAPGAPLTREAVAEMVADAQRLGKLEASVPQAIRDVHADRMAEMAPATRSAFLEGLAAAHVAASPKAGETPAQPSARAPNSAARTTVPFPTTQTEYFLIAKNDPKRRAALDADPSFDVSDLPAL